MSDPRPFTDDELAQARDAPLGWTARRWLATVDALQAALAARPQLVQVGWYTPSMADGPNVGSLLDGKYDDNDEPVYRVAVPAGSATSTDWKEEGRKAAAEGLTPDQAAERFGKLVAGLATPTTEEGD